MIFWRLAAQLLVKLAVQLVVKLAYSPYMTLHWWFWKERIKLASNISYALQNKIGTNFAKIKKKLKKFLKFF